MASEPDVKFRADVEYLQAQTDKIRTEITKLQKELNDRSDKFRSFVIESVKVLGAVILGVGGTIAAFTGYQLSEVKKEKADLDLQQKSYEIERKAKEIGKLEADVKRLEGERAKSREALDRMRAEITSSQAELNAVQDRLTQIATKGNQAETAKALESAEGIFSRVDDQLRRAQDQIRPAAPVRVSAQAPAMAAGELAPYVKRLFGATPLERWSAFDYIVRNFSSDPRLVPELLDAGEKNFVNQNGVFHVLTILDSVSREQLLAEKARVKSFAERARQIGPKSAERAGRIVAKL